MFQRVNGHGQDGSRSGGPLGGGGSAAGTSTPGAPGRSDVSGPGPFGGCCLPQAGPPLVPAPVSICRKPNVVSANGSLPGEKRAGGGANGCAVQLQCAEPLGSDTGISAAQFRSVHSLGCYFLSDGEAGSTVCPSRQDGCLDGPGSMYKKMSPDEEEEAAGCQQTLALRLVWATSASAPRADRPSAAWMRGTTTRRAAPLCRSSACSGWFRTPAPASGWPGRRSACSSSCTASARSPCSCGRRR